MSSPYRTSAAPSSYAARAFWRGYQRRVTFHRALLLGVGPSVFLVGPISPFWLFAWVPILVASWISLRNAACPTCQASLFRGVESLWGVFPSRCDGCNPPPRLPRKKGKLRGIVESGAGMSSSPYS